ncbi:MAG: hypothetical protein KBT00_08360 [Bacteroidales bacterium]|nr:hypothetical protein [Candidatus Cacconaster merdequi]
MSGMFRDGGEWAWKLLTKKRKVSAADNSYMDNNGLGPKVFKTILKIIGNKYNG